MAGSLANDTGEVDAGPTNFALLRCQPLIKFMFIRELHLPSRARDEEPNNFKHEDRLMVSEKTQSIALPGDAVISVGRLLLE